MADCKKKRGKKDRATAEAHSKRHSARRIASDSKRKQLHAQTRAALIVAKRPVTDISRWARELRRSGRIARA